MMTPRLNLWRVDWHLLALLSLTVLVNLPLLPSTLLFANDTLHSLTFFHFAYRDLFLHHEIPRWLPYLGYGSLFDFYLLTAVLPTDYVAMAVGCLCGITNSLLLFKLSLILCQGVLVLGLYLLARTCFATLPAVWMVCLGALLTTSWMFSSAWSLTVFYMMPLELWFLVRFLQGKHPANLWLAGLTEGLSLLGTIPYIAPLHLFIVVVFLASYLCLEPGLWRAFFQVRNFIHPLFFLCAFYFVLIGLWVHGIDVVWMSPLRDPETGNVSLGMFLGQETNFRRQPLAVMLRMFAIGDLYYGEFVGYVGILPLAAFIYALLRRRDALFLSIAAIALALFWFSLGGWFSTLVYYVLPLMKKYRYITAAWNFLRLFLLLLGGFGIDQLLRDLRGLSRPAAVPSGKTRQIIFIVLACCVVDHLVSNRGAYDASPAFFFGDRFFPEIFEQQRFQFGVAGLELGKSAFLMLRFAAYGSAFGLLWLLSLRVESATDPAQSMLGRRRAELGVMALLMVYVIDCGCQYSQILKHAPWRPPGTPVAEVFDVHEMVYRPQRYRANSLTKDGGDLPADADQVRRVLLTGPAGFLFGFTFVLMDADLFLFSERIDQVMPSIKEMVDVRTSPSGVPITPVQRYEALQKDGALRRSAGDGLDKARLIHEAVFVRGDQEAAAAFAHLPNPDRKIILEGDPPDKPKAKGAADEAVHPATNDRIANRVFTANRVVFDVSAQSSGWLFYADAYHAGWKGLVDGEPAPVYRANVGFKAIWVPQGDHEVTFYFDGGLRDRLGLGLIAVTTLLALTLTCMMAAAPWLLMRSPFAAEPTNQDATVPNPGLGILPIWSALAMLAAFAGGLFIADFMCVSLVLLALAVLALLAIPGRFAPGK